MSEKNNSTTKDTKNHEEKTSIPEIEMRVLSFENTEFRIDDDKPLLTGYAAKFNSWTNLGWFEEKIDPGFFDDVLKDDVRCLKNHDPNLIIGRTTNKTLRIKTNTVGLHYENDLPDTNTGRDVRVEVKTKLITGCSFAFTVAEGGEKWVRYNDGRLPQRTLLKCEKLYDVGPVTYPAYQDTSVAARSLEKAKENSLKRGQDALDTKSDKSDESDKSEKSDSYELTAEQKKKNRRLYEKAGRIIDRNKQAEA